MNLIEFLVLLIQVTQIYRSVAGQRNPVSQYKMPALNKDQLHRSIPVPHDKVMHQASLRYKIDDQQFGTGHICGGSLITYRSVLTAAHCLYFYDKVHNEIILVDPSEFIVVLGTLQRTVVTPDTLIYNVISLVHHKDYDLTTGKNDIGIMVMDKYVPVNHPTVKMVALPMLGSVELKGCYISGWATTGEDGVSTPSNDLIVSNLDVLSTQQCEIDYKGELYPGFHCAGTLGNESEPCGGDDGGPVVCGNFLIGVQATGYKCNNKNKPALYTDVNYYLDWIRSNRDKETYSKSNILYCSKITPISGTLLSALYYFKLNKIYHK